MKCPLFVLSYMLKVGEAPTHQAECLKEECAWWDEEQKRCDPTGLVHWVRALIAELWAIKEKMPKDLAPRG